MSCFGGEPTRRASFATAMREWLSLASRLSALIVLIIYLPAFVLAGLLVVMTPGPTLVRKAYRRGRNADEIVYLFEFRTECWLTGRGTAAGDFLRAAGLQSLPRLLNVLMGEVLAGERLIAFNA